MVLSQYEKGSLFWLLVPFFGLWVLFWLVPLILGIDLSLQSPTFTAPHREVIESTGTNPPPFYLSWNLTENSEVIQRDNMKYIGLQNFSNVLEDAKFYKALTNTLFIYHFLILLIIMQNIPENQLKDQQLSKAKSDGHFQQNYKIYYLPKD